MCQEIKFETQCEITTRLVNQWRMRTNLGKKLEYRKLESVWGRIFVTRGRWNLKWVELFLFLKAKLPTNLSWNFTSCILWVIWSITFLVFNFLAPLTISLSRSKRKMKGITYHNNGGDRFNCGGKNLAVKI